MVKVRIFHQENNIKNKSIYAVTGTNSSNEAVTAVIRFKKQNLKTITEYKHRPGSIRPYKDANGKVWDGLYADRDGGTPCIIVTK